MSRYIFNLRWKVGHILFFPLTDYFFFEGLTPTLHLDAKMALVPGLGLCSLSNMSQEQTQVLLLCPSVLSSPTVPSVPWGQEPSPEVGECAFCRPKSLLLTFFPLTIIPYTHIRSKPTKQPFLYEQMVSAGGFTRFDLTLVHMCMYYIMCVCLHVYACVRQKH